MRNVLLSLFLILCQFKGYYESQLVNHTELEALIDQLPTKSCMSKAQMAEAITSAAYETRHGPAVVLTTCNLKCIKYLFKAFIWSVEHATGGDFSSHIIVVANGIEAYLYCDHLRTDHKHHCVLDRLCLGPAVSSINTSNAQQWGSPVFWLMVGQKPAWMEEVLNHNVSVLWTDMDVTYFRNPLTVMYDILPPFDLAVESGYWNKDHIFPGYACCMSGCPNPIPKNLVSCGTGLVNSGIIFFRPTPVGKILMELYLAAVVNDYIVSGKTWNGTSKGDYQLLLEQAILVGGSYSAKTFSWDPANKTYVETGNVTRGHQVASIWRISSQVIGNRCHGLCGTLGPNMGYSHYYDVLPLEVKQDAERYLGEPLPHDASEHLVCVMPEKEARRTVAIHNSCCGDYDQKKKLMLELGMLKWSWNETEYKRQALIPRRHYGNPSAGIPDVDILPVVEPEWSE